MPYCPAWNTIFMPGLVLLTAPWIRQISYRYGYVGLLVLHMLASLESVAHCLNVFSLGIFYKYCFGRCLSELTELVLLHYSRGRSTPYSKRLRDFLSPFLNVIRMSM